MGCLAVEEDTIAGACAFRSPPRNSEVEIAYFAFPEFEGHGFATEVAVILMQVGQDREPGPGFLRLPARETTLPTASCRTWDLVSVAKRATKMIV